MIPLRSSAPQYRAVIRFSIFDPEWLGWLATNSGRFDSPEEYRDWLWAPDRLEARLAVFGRYTAPIYQQIADRHDFRVLVQHSEGFPAEYRDRLHSLADRYPALRPVPVPGWVEARDTVEQDMQRDGRTGTVVMLRVDDDDILSADFADLLQQHVIPQHHGWCVSLGRGMAARLDGTELRDLRWVHTPLIAIGQAFLGRYHARRKELDLSPLLSHRKVPQTLPTVLDSREVAYVHVRHVNQDSRLTDDAEAAEQSVVASLRRLEKVADTAGLREKFPTLTSQLDAIDRRQARNRT